MESKHLISDHFRLLSSLTPLGLRLACSTRIVRRRLGFHPNVPIGTGQPGRSRLLDVNSDEYHRTHVARAIQNHDIVPGMSQQEVVSAWGRPTRCRSRRRRLSWQ